MRWETILNTAKKKVYELWQKDAYLLSLTYNATTGTARIEAADEKRMFIISKEGFLRNKTVLRNEYGLRVGKLGHEHKQSFIELDGNRFFYTIHHQTTPELIIYKESEDNPLLVCDISPAISSKQPEKENEGITGLLMSLCWILFQPFNANSNPLLAVGK